MATKAAPLETKKFIGFNPGIREDVWAWIEGNLIAVPVGAGRGEFGYNWGKAGGYHVYAKNAGEGAEPVGRFKTLKAAKHFMKAA